MLAVTPLEWLVQQVKDFSHSNGAKKKRPVREEDEREGSHITIYYPSEETGEILCRKTEQKRLKA